jgi:hypothetical protein
MGVPVALRHAAVALAAACLLMACSDSGSERAECEEEEAIGFPAMEALASDSLPGVDYESHRWSHCAEDDGGFPRPTVTVVLEKGQSKAEARELLVETGWQQTERSEWEFRQGYHQAGISGMVGPRRTVVSFAPPTP